MKVELKIGDVNAPEVARGRGCEDDAPFRLDRTLTISMATSGLDHYQRQRYCAECAAIAERKAAFSFMYRMAVWGCGAVV